MKCCYGVSTALPEDIIPLLPRGMVHSVPGGTSNTDALLVSGIDSLRKNWSSIKDTGIVVIVFDARVRLDSWAIPELDLTVSLTRQLSTDNTITYKARNPIKSLLRRTAKSFVSNFVTLAYKTRDPERQAQLRKEVFTSIWTGKRAAYSTTVNKKSADLLNLLNGADAIALELACQQIRTGIPVRQAAIQNSIAPFDLNYLMKFMGK
jgi:hypothetical protein